MGRIADDEEGRGVSDGREQREQTGNKRELVPLGKKPEKGNRTEHTPLGVFPCSLPVRRILYLPEV
jgi:hypothetical protein